MKYNRLISQSHLVSEVGFGAWQLGKGSSWASMTEEEAIELVLEALDLGVNFFDTAPNYGFGTSEKRLGRALKAVDREKVVINTKFGHTVNGELDFRFEAIRPSLEGSLRRLDMDYVDSLILHNPPFSYLNGFENPHYEILEQLKSEGKIRAYGASLDHADEMKEFINGTNGKVIEAFFNIFHQGVAEAFDLALKNDVRIIAKIPLDSGWLTGKYHDQSTFNDIRKRWSTADITLRASLVEKLKTILPAEQSLTQTALSFCMAYEAVSTVIPGNKNKAQLRQNVASTHSPMPKAARERIEQFFKTVVEPHNIPW